MGRFAAAADLPMEGPKKGKKYEIHKIHERVVGSARNPLVAQAIEMTRPGPVSAMGLQGPGLHRIFPILQVFNGAVARPSHRATSS